MDRLAALGGICCVIPGPRLYEDLAPWEPAFRDIASDLLVSEDGAQCWVKAPPHPESAASRGSPSVLQGALQAARVWVRRYGRTVVLSSGFSHHRIVRPVTPGETYLVRIRPLTSETGGAPFALWILDSRGALYETALGLPVRGEVSGALPRSARIEKPEPDPLAGLRASGTALAVVELRAVAPFATESLSALERQRHDLMGIRRRQGFLAGRLALKNLARNLYWDETTPARDLHTLAGDGRRPRCPVPFGDAISCSLSHDNRFAVAAAGSLPVGVDVEPLSGRVLRGSRLFMSPEESALVSTSPLGEIEACLRIWSIKEGVAKISNLPLPRAWKATHVHGIGWETSQLTLAGEPARAFHTAVEGHLFTLVQPIP
jgi:phosphopantetheinyl transferase